MADQTPQSPTLKDLPKVQSDLKSQLENFDSQCLKNIDPQEKVVLPTAEGITFSHIYFIRCNVQKKKEKKRLLEARHSLCFTSKAVNHVPSVLAYEYFFFPSKRAGCCRIKLAS